MSEHTAGTAGAGYRADLPGHAFDLDPRDDYGRRATCTACGCERSEHLERPVRRAS